MVPPIKQAKPPKRQAVTVKVKEKLQAVRISAFVTTTVPQVVGRVVMKLRPLAIAVGLVVSEPAVTTSVRMLLAELAINAVVEQVTQSNYLLCGGTNICLTDAGEKILAQ